MKRKLCIAVLAVLAVAGVLRAADNSWRFPVPALGGILKGDLIYAVDGFNLGNINAVASGNVLASQGTSTQPAWGKVVLTTMVSGVLPAANGGTGSLVGIVKGDVIIATSTAAYGSLVDVATGSAIISGGVGSLPTYGKITLTGHVSGVLPTANGGTNNSVAITTGDLIVATSGTAYGSVPDVASGQILTSGGVGSLPAYSASIPSGVSSAEKTDGQIFLPAYTYCKSDVPSAQLVPTRIAASDWALARTAAGAETYNITCALSSWLQRTTASKGIKITSMSLVLQVTGPNMTTHTWGKVATQIYATGVANSIGADLSTPPTLNTGTQTLPYTVSIPMAAAAYFPPQTLEDLNMEWQAVLATGNVYRVYGVSVAFSRTDM